MRVAFELEFPDERAADVIRWLQAAPEGVEVYLVTKGQSKIESANNAAQAIQSAGDEV